MFELGKSVSKPTNTQLFMYRRKRDAKGAAANAREEAWHPGPRLGTSNIVAEQLERPAMPAKRNSDTHSPSVSLCLALSLSLAHAHTQWEQPARPPKRDAEAMNQGNENNFRLKASVGFCRSPLAASHVCAHRPCVNLLCARAFGYLGTCADSQSLAALGLVRLFRFIPPNVPKRR